MSRLNVAIALVCACIALSGSIADAKQRQKQETHIICNQQGCRGGAADTIRTTASTEPYKGTIKGPVVDSGQTL